MDDEQVTEKPSLAAFEKSDLLSAVQLLPIRLYLWLFRENILKHLSPHQEPNASTVARNFSANIMYMASICNARNIRFFSVLQPLNGVGNRKLTDDDILLLNGLKNDIIFQKQTRFNFYIEYYRRIRQMNKDNPVLHDFTHVFDNEAGQIYFDTVHFSDKGQRLVAEDLYAMICEEYRK